jgi:hypothetical protein
MSDPTLLPVFQTLPGASFIVNGVTLLAKFDGEFASHSSAYAGSGAIRYSANTRAPFTSALRQSRLTNTASGLSAVLLRQHYALARKRHATMWFRTLRFSHCQQN